MSSALVKHVAYFDFNNDGKVTIWETFVGFRRLGFNLITSFVSAILINMSMSYPSQDSWIPDPFFRIVVKNSGRLKHGSDSGIYDNDGNLNEERFEQVFAKFSKNGRLSFNDLWRMTDYHRCVWDIFGYVGNKFEWLFTYLLVWDKGYLTKEEMKGTLDGSFFYKIDSKLNKKPQNQ